MAQPAVQPEKVIDYIGGWRPFPNYRRLGVSTNRFGLRGRDCLRTKPDGTTRLLCIGDSCVFGVPPDEAPWPAQLQARLDDRRPSTAEVLNAGVNGQSSINICCRLPQLLRGLQPDAILISVLANDAWSLQPPSGADLAGYVPEPFVRNVQCAIDCCVKHGARPVLVTPPGMVPTDHTMTPFMMRVFHQAHWLGEQKQPETMRLLYDRHNEALRDLADRNGIACIDTAAAFDRLHDHERGLLFMDTCHMNQDGNAAMAAIIADEITARELV
jgi:lysophospholipase L1-like esterase